VTHLKIRPYDPQDLIGMEVMDAERRRRDGQSVETWARVHAQAGPSFTFEDEAGAVVFCCGVDELWAGVGEAWACFSPLAKKYPHTWQAMKWVIGFAKSAYHRIQAVLDVDDDAAIRMDERLGFVREGILRKYGPHGEDRFMYAIVREDAS
jgi:hypothetical protein